MGYLRDLERVSGRMEKFFKSEGDIKGLCTCGRGSYRNYTKPKALVHGIAVTRMRSTKVDKSYYRALKSLQKCSVSLNSHFV